MLVGLGLALLAVIAAVVLVTTRSSGGGLAGVQVNHVGIIDPESGDIVDEEEVGARPGPVAFGEGTIWVGNEEEQTLTPIVAATREKDLVSLGPVPDRIVVSPTAVWVANGEWPGGSLQRVDPDFGLVGRHDRGRSRGSNHARRRCALGRAEFDRDEDQSLDGA